MTVISQNMAMANTKVDPSRNPDDFRRRIVVMAPGDPARGSEQGVHVRKIAFDQAPFRMEHDPNDPYADADGYVRYTNVDTAIEMVNSVAVRRAYEANITAAEATKNMIQTSLRLLA